MSIDIIKAIILGIVEGVTEFLPVSSTGHLILAGDLISFTGERAKVFEIFIQLGAILSVVWLYRTKVFSVVKGIGTKEANRFIVNLILAFLPAAIVGFLTHSIIKEYLFNVVSVASALIVGGLLILFIESFSRKPRIQGCDNITPHSAIGVGLAQVLSLFPGVSRSGATIMGGLVIGMDRKTATEFSFFLAIPTMFAATCYDLLKNISLLSFSDLSLFAVGFVSAFVSALIVIKIFIGFVTRHDFRVFAYYRIVFGIMILLFMN